MPYQPAPFFHVRPAYQRELADRPRAARPPMARRAKVAAAFLAVTTIVLAGAGIALGAPTSARLSAQGWQTFQGLQAMDLNVDTDHPERARGQLSTYIARCSGLPGHGAQSTGIRMLCKDTLGFVDQTLGRRALRARRRLHVPRRPPAGDQPRHGRQYGGGAHGRGDTAARAMPDGLRHRGTRLGSGRRGRTRPARGGHRRRPERRQSGDERVDEVGRSLERSRGRPCRRQLSPSAVGPTP
jgi:hypothetical protein